MIDDTKDFCVKELYFVNRDYRGIWRELLEDLSRMLDWNRLSVLPAVAGDVLDPIAIVNLRLENLNFLSGNHSTPDSADEFFSFSGEHAAADNLNTSLVMSHFSLAILKMYCCLIRRFQQMIRLNVTKKKAGVL